VEGRPAVALVVALTLAVTALAATVVASLLPLGLDRLGVDPALASGPVATVIQDMLSVAIYLGIATAVLG
jgi:magnesium transporter